MVIVEGVVECLELGCIGRKFGLGRIVIYSQISLNLVHCRANKFAFNEDIKT